MGKELSKEEILSKHSKNYSKTVEKDEKTLYHLQLNGWEAINAMREFAEQERRKEAIAFLIDTTGDMFKHNAEQLYQLYCEQKLKSIV